MSDQNSMTDERSITAVNAARPLKRHRWMSKNGDLVAAFAIVFIPMSAIACILCALVFWGGRAVIYRHEGSGLLDLPTIIPTNNSYYTKTDAGDFLLVGSWASTLAGFIIPSFMLLYSFVVAKEMTRIQEKIADGNNFTLLYEILNGSWNGALHWVQWMILRRRKIDKSSARAVNIAAFVFVIAGLLNVMILVGDNALHIATDSIMQKYYEDNNTAPPAINFSDPSSPYAAGWTTIPRCQSLLTSELPQNRSAGTLPCSLYNADGLFNLDHPELVYQTLTAGISQISANFSVVSQVQGSVDDQVVTIKDPKTGISHSMLFNLNASYEYDDKDKLNFGIDYIANTTSMATQCDFATQACQFEALKPLSNQNLSVPFNCSAIFYGDLNFAPLTGLERAPGWNTSFYELIDRIPKEIPVQAQSNPFYFNASAVINSVSDPANFLRDLPEGAIANLGKGRAAIAFSCNATIYDVTYSLVDGFIKFLHVAPSDPRKASIIQAPLQVGFGQYHLFLSAAFAVLNYDPLSWMSDAFSQTGMALASGVFVHDVNQAQRFRYDQLVTQVAKGPFWFLVISCALTAMLILVAGITALMLRRSENVLVEQEKLMPIVLSAKKLRKPKWEDL